MNDNMDDNDFNTEKLIIYTDFYHDIIPPALARELVYVIDEDEDAKTNQHPYVNLAEGQVGENQWLLIGNEPFPFKTIKTNVNDEISVGVNFGNRYRLTNRLTTFTNNNWFDFGAPTFKRPMVLTNFGGYEHHAGKYGLMFSQIDTTLPLGRPSGPQAELIRYGDQRRLYVIDVLTAQRLNSQCTNWFNRWSLTYELVWAAHCCLNIATALNRFYYLIDVVGQQYIDDLRNDIHIYCPLISQRLSKAMSVEKIYKSAIVRQVLMLDIQPHTAYPPPEPLVLVPPVLDNIIAEPFNADANINDVVLAIQNWAELCGRISQNLLFHRPWIDIFEQFANRNTSIAFLDIHANDGHIHRHVQLPVGHNIDITIWRVDDNTFQLELDQFPVNQFYRLCRLPDQHLPDQDQWLAYKNSPGGEGFNTYLPLHSHGLSGSNEALDETGNDHNGNNGYQVMSLRFGIQMANGIIQNTHRLYFVNRNMAKELRYYFETSDVMATYQRWFCQLLPVSRDLTDAHRLVRQLYNMNDEHPWVINLRDYNNILNEYNVLLFEQYECLVRLEQIWKYSILEPNTVAQVEKLLEPHIKWPKINASIYQLGVSFHVLRANQRG